MTDLIAGAKPEINYGSAKEFYNPEDQRFHKNTGGTQTTYELFASFYQLLQRILCLDD